MPALIAGLADVVEHEAHLGALLHHLDDVRQMMVEDADVEREVVRGEQLQAGDEVRLDAEVRVGLVLDQPADAAQGPVLAELVDLRRDRRTPLERQRGDHALQRRLALRKLLDPRRLGEMLRIVDVDLGEDERSIFTGAAALKRSAGSAFRFSEGAPAVQA